jgi:hypothetical protein
MFIFDPAEFQKFEAALTHAGIQDQFKDRCEPDLLINGGINCQPSTTRTGKSRLPLR